MPVFPPHSYEDSYDIWFLAQKMLLIHCLTLLSHNNKRRATPKTSGTLRSLFPSSCAPMPQALDASGNLNFIFKCNLFDLVEFCCINWPPANISILVRPEKNNLFIYPRNAASKGVKEQGFNSQRFNYFDQGNVFQLQAKIH